MAHTAKETKMNLLNPELGFYALAGQPESPRDLIEELQQGEAMGLGTAFLSERYNSKEICTCLLYTSPSPRDRG